MRCRRTTDARGAFTLVEVVAGIALLAVLLVGVVQSIAAHKRTLARAADRIEAAAVADRLLGSLSGRGGLYPTNARGLVPTHPDWAWSLTRTGTQMLEGFPVDTLRLEIVDTTPQPSSLLRVELVQDRGAGQR